jgi:hypothetical protein
MNCQECLSELATGSLRDLTPESEVMRHCSTCPDCGPLATVLRDREYNAATILNTLPPLSNPLSVAETAGMLARRRRVGRVVVFLSGAALVVTFWIMLFATGFGRMMMGVDRPASSPETETIPLSCLTPEQAGQIVDPYLRSPGSYHKVYYVDKSRVTAITIHGTPHEIAQSSSVIERFENNPNTCQRPSIAEQLRQMQEELQKAGVGVTPPDNAAPLLAPSPGAKSPVKKK